MSMSLDTSAKIPASAPADSGPQIAVIGSGPAGCYLAQSLTRSAPDVRITIIDRLVSPFGLVRYGVAADHQHTKAITRQFERLFQSPQVRFAGDIEIGRDLSLDDLRAHFDAVVVATGLTADRGLGVPGADLPGVVGSGLCTRVLNAHPDAPTELPDLGDDVVVIGAGNVALDVLRFLVKDEAGYDASDIADPALAAYLAAPARRVALVSRSAAVDAKGDAQMLKELSALPRARYATPDGIDPEPGRELDRAGAARLAAFRELLDAERPAHPGPEVTLRFGLSPLRVVGADRVEAVEFAVSGTDEVVRIPATAVVTAIGFTAAPDHALAAIVADPAATGRVAPGLYRTGWAKRGPRGAIPENRACAKSVADEIAADLGSGALPVDPARRGFDGLPEAVRARAVSYDQWLALDAYERELAPAGRVRRKLPDHDQMAAIARATTTA